MMQWAKKFPNATTTEAKEEMENFVKGGAPLIRFTPPPTTGPPPTTSMNAPTPQQSASDQLPDLSGPTTAGGPSTQLLPNVNMSPPQYPTDQDARGLVEEPGQIESGNINLQDRPQVKNKGKTSTVLSMSFEEDGVEILVPMVSDDGRIMTEDEAIEQYHRTGNHLGKFDTPKHANAYAKKLHEEQAKLLKK
jgi:hypothetical protein